VRVEAVLLAAFIFGAATASHAEVLFSQLPAMRVTPSVLRVVHMQRRTRVMSAFGQIGWHRRPAGCGRTEGTHV
jgi:hypothetical protein